MDMLIFDDLEKLGRIVLTTVMVYVMIVLVTKISGKRSTSQLNNFDWIMTVMIGSLGASTILLKNVPLIEGSSAILTLYALQFLVTKYASISPQFSDVILSDPRIVFYQGQFLPEAMREERLTRQELESAMRAAEVNDVADVEAIIFESNAKLTVIKKPPKNHESTRDDGISQTIVAAMRDNT